MSDDLRADDIFRKSWTPGVGSLDRVRPMPMPEPERILTLTPASSVKVRPVHWLWHERIALGTLALLAGRQGIGKSTLAYTMAADLTLGRMPGVYAGQPKSVIVAATEDSWEHTIVPRLMGANADLTRIYRVDVSTVEGAHVPMVLPTDLPGLALAVKSHDVALILLDPIISRLNTKLDSHKDAPVRVALEPIVALADETRSAVLGLIHLNKSGSTDALNLVMASTAFTAVARAVLFAMKDPNDEKVRLLGEPKNNLGRDDLPTMTYTIEPVKVADTDEGPVWTGRLAWGADSGQSVQDALVAQKDIADGDTPAGNEAADWLLDYLEQAGGEADSASVKAAAKQNGHAVRTLGRARTKLKVETESRGFPRRTYWRLPLASTLGDVFEA